MMTTHPEDDDNDIGALERTRKRLYEPSITQEFRTQPSPASHEHIPHVWKESSLPIRASMKRSSRAAGTFFVVAFAFFLISLGVAGYLIYFGGNTVSVDKIDIALAGPMAIAGGDVVPLTLTITNKNSVAIENATVEISFPESTRSASDVLSSYPRYTENLGTIGSGETVTRQVKAILFGEEGKDISIPIFLSYNTAGSNATFVKKSSYSLAISSMPLSISVETLSETVSGAPITLTLIARSNATTPMENVVISGTFPFGFSVTSSSLPLNSTSFLVGTLLPGASKTIQLTGTLAGQNTEQKIFHFTIGTAKTASDINIAVSYLTQDASVIITAPFISASLSINGNSGSSVSITPGSFQNVTVSYKNTLSTTVENAVISVTVSGSAVDYSSIKTTNGFYRSSDHAIVFSRDTDPSLATLAPGASGIGTFSFQTLASGSLPALPTASFTVSVSGTRIGQSNVPEEIHSSVTKTIKVITSALFSASSMRIGGPFENSGPIPPSVGQETTYTVTWSVRNPGSAIAGGTVTAQLPTYVLYTGYATNGISFDNKSRTVTWNIGDLAQGASRQGSFQVSITPSSSQRGTEPVLSGTASFSGYDRFAGAQISAKAEPINTETKGDSGYSAADATVQ